MLEKNMIGFALFFCFDPSSSTNYEVSSFPGLSLGPGVERERSYIEQKRLPRTKNICCWSVTKSSPTLCESMNRQASLSSTISQSLLKLMSIESVMPSSHPLSSPSPPAFNLSQQQSLPMSQLFASGSQSIGALTSASVLPMNIQGLFP